MGFAKNAMRAFSGESEPTQGEDNSVDEYTISSSQLRKMAVGDKATVPTIKPFKMLTETEVELAEQNAKEMKEQVQLHGRKNIADSSSFDSHCQISEDGFKAGQKNIQRGLNSRANGSVNFGEFVLNEARAEFTLQNHRVQRARKTGDLKVGQLNQQHNQAIESLGEYMERM